MSEKIIDSAIVLTGKDKTSAAFRSASKNASGLGKNVRQLSGKMSRMGAVAAAAATAAAAAFSVSGARITRDYTAAISELQAITGAAGKDLAFISDAAREFGATTTLSATDAAQAFKLVASAKPDLLQNAEALKAVTRETITLAEASGIELPDAARSLGMALNQFNADADEAGRFINVLAAASQQGAVEIPDLSDALVNAGTVANQAGLDFETTVAALEAMGKAGLVGSRAGNQLQSVLVKLQRDAESDFNPSIYGMSEALENLANANLSVAEKEKLVGVEGIKVIDALIAQRSEFERLDSAIRGTNTAYEQAAVRTDNLDGDLKTLNSRYEELTLVVGTGLEPAMRDGVQATTEFIDYLIANQQVLWDFAEGIFGITRGIQSMSVAEIDTEIDKRVEEMLGLQQELQAAIERNAFSNNNLGENGLIVRLNAELEELAKRHEELAQRRAELIGGVSQSDSLEMFDMSSLPMRRTVEDPEDTSGLDTKIARMQQEFMSEMELAMMQNEERNAWLDEAREKELISQEEYYKMKLQLGNEYDAEMSRIEKKGLTDRQKFEQMSLKNQGKFVLGQFSTMLAGADGFGKAMFRVKQVAALAEAAIAIPKTAMDAFAWGTAMGGPVVGAAMAAAATAVQVANMASIASAGSGGGGGGSFSSAVPSISAQPEPFGQGASSVATSPETLPAAPREEVSITLPESGLVSVESVRDLIESINENTGDGMELSVRGALA